MGLLFGSHDHEWKQEPDGTKTINTEDCQERIFSHTVRKYKLVCTDPDCDAEKEGPFDSVPLRTEVFEKVDTIEDPDGLITDFEYDE